MVHRHARPLALAALAAAPLLLAGCAAMGELAKSAFQKPTVDFKSAKVESVDFDGATVAVELVLHNPNGFGLRLARVQTWLQLDGKVVTRGEVAGGLTIPAAGQVPVHFKARLPFAEVPRLLELVAQGGQVAYTVGGLVAVETPIGQLDLPVEHAGHVDLPRLPAFRLASAKVRLASLSEVELELTLLVDNQNPFPLPEGELKYALALGGEVVATADGEALGAVPAHGQGRVVIPVRLSLQNAGRALGAVVRGGTAEVRLSGQAKVGALPVPLDLLGKAVGK